MSHLSRRGLTLVELLVALVIMGIVSAALYRVLVNNQRVYQAQTQRIDLQQNIRAAATIMPGELREADANEGDIVVMSPTSITFRAMRWMGYMCNAPLTGPSALVTNPILTVVMSNRHVYGARAPNIGDSVLIAYEGDEGTRQDDSWVQGSLTAMINGNCPGGTVDPDNGPGRILTVAAFMPSVKTGMTPPAANIPVSIYAGGAIRGFVTVTYGLYQPAGDTSWYIGLQRPGNPMQPLIGPVLANGLSLAYYDSTGAVLDPANAANRALVERVDMTVRGRTAQPVRRVSGGTVLGAIVDSVTVRVTLRNNKRF
jgi:prepilin-type N-terminal cleavage/methylation domain-containing protein